MSRLAMDQITITDVTDGEKGVSVKIVTPFYALGTAAPDKPTVNPPASVWTTTEPEYIKGKNLYTTQRTVLEDSTFSYSDVSLDSSYKASEQAITTADTANTTAGEAKTTAGEAKTTSGEAKTIATEAKTASTTNKNNLDSEIEARNQAIANLKMSIDADVEAVSQKAADAQKAGDDAANDLTIFRTSTESQLTSINGLVGGLRTDVDTVSNTAATLASGLDSANTKITSTSDDLTGLTNTVSNISKTADDSMALSTTNHQDLAGFKTTVQQTYSTKQDTLNQVTTVDQKADALSATLSKDYQKTADSDAKYSTKAELTATSKSITASVAETYATKSVVDALKNIADKAIETWQGPGEPTLTNLPASDWTTADLKKQHSGDVYYDTDSGFAYRFGSADGTAYKWGRISDSDITKALNLASKAQETADGAVAGVTKLNTDIPLTYASKSEVKVTTDGIKADVVEAKRIGQTGVDNSAALAVRADGIDATLSQQATNIDNNVKAIAQVNMRADSLSTSITQVSNKTDQALANAQELVRNGNFEAGDANWSGSNSNNGIVHDTAHSGMYSWAKQGDNSTYLELDQQLYAPIIPGHTYRFSVWARIDPYAYVVGGNRSIYATKSGSNEIDSDIFQSSQPSQTWFEYVQDWTAPADAVSFAKLRYSFVSSTSTIWLDDVSLKDVTEAITAQQSADAASSKADTAISQSSQLSQDLSGFKTSVAQLYETKSDSTSKATTAQQNLDGFEQTVQATYLDKSNASNTYSTKAEMKATTDQISSNLTSVGNTANSAMTKATDAQQNLDGFKNTVSATYSTKQALADTDDKATSAQTAANLALANAEELVINGGPQTGDMTGWAIGEANGTVTVMQDDSGRPFFRIHRNDGGANVQLTQINDNRFNVIPGRTVRVQAELSGTTVSCCLRIHWYIPASNQWLYRDMFGIGPLAQAGWQIYGGDCGVPDGATLAYVSSYNLTPNSDLDIRVISVKDVTEVAALRSDVAATYATQSSVQQTSSQITSQVETKYATKDDVTSKYTTLQQTDNAFDARIGDVQNRAGVLETLIHSDANGVRVGKTVNGSYSGYSALVNANGSFDVLNPAGQMVSRFNSDGIQMPSGLVSVNGIPMVEDITDKLVFMNTYWQYLVKATRIFNQVIMQVWCKRHGDPAGDYVPTTWRSSQLFKIKRGYRPYGVPGDTNGQDINFPMANNAVTDAANVSPAVYVQVTDTFISIRSPYGDVRFKNDVTWLSGVISWVIDPDHQTDNDDSASQN